MFDLDQDRNTTPLGDRREHKVPCPRCRRLTPAITDVCDLCRPPTIGELRARAAAGDLEAEALLDAHHSAMTGGL